MVSAFDLTKLQNLLKDFYSITGLRITVFTDKYEEIASYPKEIAPICRFIRSNPEAEAACHACDREACKAAALCSHFQIGKTTLYEISNQNYGMGIAEHIRTLRIEHVKKLLTEHQELSVGEVADRCGFSDCNYFSTVFRRLTGTSPGKYRRLSRTDHS